MLPARCRISIQQKYLIEEMNKEQLDHLCYDLIIEFRDINPIFWTFLMSLRNMHIQYPAGILNRRVESSHIL